MPAHTHYVEPFAGGLAVLLAKNPEGVSEVVNDISLDLTNFWMVLQDESLFGQFKRLCEATPFSEAEWHDAGLEDPSPLAHVKAHRFFVRCRMSMAGRMRSFTPITKTRTRRGMNNEVSAWLTAVEGLQAVHERLKRVLILNRDALEVIKGQDSPQTFFMCDPPYCSSTRTAPSVYTHEMSDDQHMSLLQTLATIRGKFILCGYRCELYDSESSRHGWNRVDVEMPNHAAGGAEKRRMTESFWMNYHL